MSTPNSVPSPNPNLGPGPNPTSNPVPQPSPGHPPTPATNPASEPPAEAVTLTVNGETKGCARGTTLPQFLQQQGMEPRLVAVEYNGQILHRQHWPQTVLAEDDNLEVVTIVGGG